MSFYLTPVTGELLINREKELETLVSELSKRNSRIGFSLTGVRRIGKTSILKDAKKRLEKRGIPVVYISVWSTMPDTLEAFIANLFDQTITAFEDRFSLKMKIANLIKLGRNGLADLLKHLKISVELGNEISYTVSFVRGDDTDVSKATYNVFKLIDDLAEKTKTKCVLIIDEFPSITELKVGKQMIGDSVIKMLRSINEEYTNVALVVSGSLAHTMHKAVLSSSAPFYKQLVNLEITPLDDTAVRNFVKKYLKKKISSKGLESLMEISSGIPYNLQILGRQLAQSKDSVLTETSVSKATCAVLEREGDVHFRDYVGLMQSTEVSVVKTMAVYGASSPKEISDASNMKLNEITALLGLLLNKGILRKTARGQYQFTDNMFKTWLSIYTQR
ncbi:MAG: ATP-binding protein [Nitrososphaera sp.]|jgi:hypothetical protein